MININEFISITSIQFYKADNWPYTVTTSPCTLDEIDDRNLLNKLEEIDPSYYGLNLLRIFSYK